MLVNFLALIILARCQKMNIQIKAMTMNLALVDLMTGVAILLDSFLSPVLPESICRPLTYLYCIGVIVSFATITGLLLDRFLAIYYPYRYQKVHLHEKQCSVIVISGTWIVGIILSVLNYVDGFLIYKTQRTALCVSYVMTGKIGLAIVTMVFCFLLVFNMFLYLLMFIKIYRLSRSAYPKNTMKGNLYSNQARVLIKLSAIIGSFMLLYTPLIVINVIVVVVDNNMAETLLTWQSFAGFLILLNSFLNPFLYVWRFTECRYTFLSMVCCCWKSRKEKYENLKKKFFVSFLQAENSYTPYRK
ncbi:sphingosine 1-phosphate receptor 1-like [Saccostrea echinata]|uniref:sphingosine 1-phosphate receptor 1-like n=1 Tax=Saccostrea echinata TaxID=191078 RepID=UPI002A810842|nr:sphingosine 1-phosphate receptor 1-like [Saccostrea echinata]